jgi:hypothetical protein
MIITLLLAGIATLLALGLMLYLAYLEMAADLPPCQHSRRHVAAHKGRPVQSATDLHEAHVRPSA